MVDYLVHDSLFLIDVSLIHDWCMRQYLCWYKFYVWYDTGLVGWWAYTGWWDTDRNSDRYRDSYRDKVMVTKTEWQR